MGHMDKSLRWAGMPLAHRSHEALELQNEIPHMGLGGLHLTNRSPIKKSLGHHLATASLQPPPCTHEVTGQTSSTGRGAMER